MSSSASNPSQPQRTPLHERSNSEKNKLQIRLVPYSPPRPETAASEPQGTEAEHSYDETPRKADEPTGASWTRTRTPLVEEGHAFDPEFEFPSPSPSPARGAWPRRDRVSESKQTYESFGSEPNTPPTPVPNRPTLASQSRRLSAPARPCRSENATPSPTRQRPQSRHRVINVRSDGTFSVGLKPARESDRTTSSFTYTSTATSHEPASISAPSADIPSSPPSSAPERSVSPPAPAPVPALARLRAETSPASSPWNYRMVGGLRKVPNTPDLKAQKGKGKGRETGKGVEGSPSEPTLPGTIVTHPTAAGLVTRSSSFNSSNESDSADSSTGETVSNFRVLGRSSPPRPDSEFLETASLPSSEEANYRVLGESSPALPPASSPGNEFLDTPGSRNFVVHGGTPPSLATFPRRPRPQYSNDSLSEQVREKYSQESLVIPPLNPHRKSSQERFGYYKRLSRESLRGRANSFSTISSIISQDTASLLIASTPNLVRIHRSSSTASFKQGSWAGQPGTSTQGARMELQPHPWASQLSPVVSEYEGSDLGSRVASAISSSAPGSRHSRQLLSIPSALSSQEEAVGASQPPSDLIERPSPAYMRGALPSPAVRDVDEHGDGLADLHHTQLQHKPSWRSYLSRRGSDRELHSAASSRAGSLTAASIPTWAWLYYGSGERRWLATVPSIQSLSEAAQSRPGSSFASGSPSAEEQQIWNPRRRPRELPAPAQQPILGDVAPTRTSEERSQQPKDIKELSPRPKKKTSSIWSPHLRFDRRASRTSIWEPPTIMWVTEGGILGLRNIQILLFAIGFGFPFAWMVAAFLPLPPKPEIEMFQQDGSATGLGISKQEAEAFDALQVAAPLINDERFQNARWWRNLNRVMSVIGLLILGAIIALVVVGTRQQWVRR